MGGLFSKNKNQDQSGPVAAPGKIIEQSPKKAPVSPPEAVAKIPEPVAPVAAPEPVIKAPEVEVAVCPPVVTLPSVEAKTDLALPEAEIITSSPAPEPLINEPVVTGELHLEEKPEIQLETEPIKVVCPGYSPPEKEIEVEVCPPVKEIEVAVCPPAEALPELNLEPLPTFEPPAEPELVCPGFTPQEGPVGIEAELSLPEANVEVAVCPPDVALPSLEAEAAPEVLVALPEDEFLIKAPEPIEIGELLLEQKPELELPELGEPEPEPIKIVCPGYTPPPSLDLSEEVLLIKPADDLPIIDAEFAPLPEAPEIYLPRFEAEAHEAPDLPRFEPDIAVCPGYTPQELPEGIEGELLPRFEPEIAVCPGYTPQEVELSPRFEGELSPRFEGELSQNFEAEIAVCPGYTPQEGPEGIEGELLPRFEPEIAECPEYTSQEGSVGIEGEFLPRFEPEIAVCPGYTPQEGPEGEVGTLNIPVSLSVDGRVAADLEAEAENCLTFEDEENNLIPNFTTPSLSIRHSEM